MRLLTANSQYYIESLKSGWQDFIANPEGTLGGVLGFFVGSALTFPVMALFAVLTVLVFVIVLSPFSMLVRALRLHSRLAAAALCLFTLLAIGYLIAVVGSIVSYFMFISSTMPRELMEGFGALLLSAVLLVVIARVALTLMLRREYEEEAPVQEACDATLLNELLGPEEDEASVTPAPASTVAMDTVPPAERTESIPVIR